MKHSILVVDDEADIVDSLERQFRKDYKVYKATGGVEALQILQKETIHLIISDQRMPDITGVQLFERAQKIQPDAIRLLLTGFTDVSSVIAAVNKGQIYRYITKPWDSNDLDITVKKAIETFDLRNELKSKNADLEAALRELKSLDVAKSQFMILIGHELKTPLTTIHSFLDLLKEEVLNPDSQKFVARISTGLDRLEQIVFDVLDILGAETGQLRAKRESRRIAELAQHAWELNEIQASKKSLNFQITGDKIIAFCDPSITLKVLRKLIHNAIKYAEENTTVVCDIRSREKNLGITITNTGPEISSSRIQQITRPFNFDADIMHHTQGLGLGLSVASKLLQLESSQLEISSSAGKTTVGFELAGS